MTNVPSYLADTVAERVFALLGAISHKLVEAAARTRQGDFSQKGLQGFDLEGKVLGLVRTGAIGQHVGRIAKGYGMEVVAFDPRREEGAARDIGFQYLEMDEPLETADIISLHVPANRHTENLISHKAFSRMKDGVLPINTSCGSVVDVNALLVAVSTGKVRAAGLDVLPEEPAVREEAELLRGDFRETHNLEDLLTDPHPADVVQRYHRAAQRIQYA